MIPWSKVAWLLTLAAHRQRGASQIARSMDRFSYRSTSGRIMVANEFCWMGETMPRRGCRAMRAHALGALGNMLLALAIVRGCAAYQQSRRVPTAESLTALRGKLAANPMHGRAA